MTPEDWSRIESLWDRARELPRQEQVAFLARSLADRPGLAEQALSLLDHASDAELLSALPTLGLDGIEAEGEIGDGLGWSGRSWAGVRIGAYQLEEELGAGGMGAVFLGRRVDGQFDQEVAIKVLHQAWVGTELERRFLAERQILSDLDHPGIARLLDGGTAESGISYVVMERIAGTPITDFCDHRSLSLDRRLELLREVCDAVAHAHARLVVHRDLKPSNILVTDDGRPKLLDFGIASLLGTESGEAESESFRLRALTPAYSSPEQRLGGRITTATDVYALGVLLFELVTGNRPVVWRAAKTPESVEPPDAAGAAVVPGLIDAGRAPGVVMSRAVVRDLDAVGRRAMAVEADDRYASVREFAEELRRIVGQVPIRARKHSTLRRTGLACRRHPRRTALAAMLVLSLLVFALVTSFQAMRLARERDEAERQRAVAEDTVDVLEGVFQLADDKGASLPVGELVDLAVERIERETEIGPLIRARLLTTLGVLYGNLGQLSKSRSALEVAAELRRESLGSDHVDTAESLRNLGILQILVEEFENAEKNLEEALAIESKLLPEDDPRIGATLDRLGMLHQARGDFDLAARAFEQSLRIRSAHGRESPEVASALLSLADVKRLAGRPEEALPIALESLEIGNRTADGNGYAVIDNLYVVGAVQIDLGHYDDAVETFSRAHKISEAHHGPDHKSSITMKSNLAAALKLQGSLENAEELYSQIYDGYRRSFGDRHSRTATILGRIASLQTERGELDLAESNLREALAIKQEVFGAEHREVAWVLRHLANNLREQGRWAEAEAEARAAIAMYERRVGPDHPDLILGFGTLGLCLEAQGRLDEAVQAFEESLAVAARSVGLDHPKAVKAQQRLDQARRPREAP